MNTLVTYVTLDQHGEPVRSQRRASGAQLAIGRGTNCQIQLPDSRVALEHARITIDARSATITAPAGHIRVNGARWRAHASLRAMRSKPAHSPSTSTHL